MFIQTQLFKDRLCIYRQNIRRGLAGVHGQQDRDQAFDNDCIAITSEGKVRARVFAFTDKPDLTDASLHLCLGAMLSVGQGGEPFSEFDHVLVSIFPVIEITEIVDQILNGHACPS